MPKSQGACLRDLKVIAGDSRDDLLRERFFQHEPSTALLKTNESANKWRWVWYPIRYGFNSCCSDTFISAHYLSPQDIYLYEYLIHQVKIFGRNEGDRLPAQLSSKDVDKLVNRNSNDPHWNIMDKSKATSYESLSTDTTTHTWLIKIINASFHSRLN